MNIRIYVTIGNNTDLISEVELIAGGGRIVKKRFYLKVMKLLIKIDNSLTLGKTILNASAAEAENTASANSIYRNDNYHSNRCNYCNSSWFNNDRSYRPANKVYGNRATG